MRIKQEFINLTFICPFTKKMTNAMMIDPKMYIHYYNFGMQWLFVEEKIEKRKK